MGFRAHQVVWRINAGKGGRFEASHADGHSALERPELLQALGKFLAPVAILGIGAWLVDRDGLLLVVVALFSSTLQQLAAADQLPRWAVVLADALPPFGTADALRTRWLAERTGGRHE